MDGLRDARGPITHFAAGGGRCGRKRKRAPETKVVAADCRPYKAAATLDAAAADKQS
jgi:hypothetical protein